MLPGGPPALGGQTLHLPALAGGSPGNIANINATTSSKHKGASFGTSGSQPTTPSGEQGACGLYSDQERVSLSAPYRFDLTDME